jgi:hypothetical protein
MKWRKENPDKYKECQVKWQKTHPNYMKNYMKKYHKKRDKMGKIGNKK